jgi:hypothetical protein
VPTLAKNGPAVCRMGTGDLPGDLKMPAAAISRPADRWRRFVRAVWIPALVFALSWDVAQFEALRDCRGGAFGGGFSSGFDVRHCEIVLRRLGEKLLKVPLPS